jgi:hypothetical protein
LDVTASLVDVGELPIKRNPSSRPALVSAGLFSPLLLRFTLKTYHPLGGSGCGGRRKGLPNTGMIYRKTAERIRLVAGAYKLPRRPSWLQIENQYYAG